MHLQLKGPSLPDLEAQVVAEYGTRASVVRVDKVLVGGIRGFFARTHYEVTIELPDGVVIPDDVLLDLPARVGIAALLDLAEESEATINGSASEPTPAPVTPPGPVVSTASDTFAKLIADLSINTAATNHGPTVVIPTSPAPLCGAGDLVIVVGVDQDPFIVANSMALAAGTHAVSVAGVLAISGADRVDDRQSALQARVKGVRNGHCVFVALGLGAARPDDATVYACAAALGSMGADQVWAAVDASRPAEDTAAWVRSIASVVAVDAVAVVGA